MKKEDVIPNTIYCTTDFNTLLEVVNKTSEIKNTDILKDDFIILLTKYILSKSGMVLVSFGEDKEMNGCMVVSRQRDKRGQYLWIDFAWINPHYPKLHLKYRDELIGTCKNLGITRIQAKMKRGYDAMEKLYDTKEIAKIIEKEVI
jgi:hypothetical protein